jgi:hypothetical protein
MLHSAFEKWRMISKKTMLMCIVSRGCEILGV